MLVRGFEFLLRGGWVMWPLFCCAIVSVAVMIERFIVLSRAGANGRTLIPELRRLLSAGHTAEALELCERQRGPVGALLAAGIRSRHLELSEIERVMEEEALLLTPHLHRRLTVLDTIITLSPLLGLLGTITGMINSFKVISVATGASASGAITGGVAEALIATATGLSIAIVTLPVYNHLTNRVNEILGQMEARGTQLLNILATTRRPLVMEEEPVASAAS